MYSFTAKIQIIGINPYVLLPAAILKKLFSDAGRDNSPIPVKGELNGFAYIQTLVKYSGKWRLYLNGPMLKGADTDVGNMVKVKIAFDDKERLTPLHSKLEEALNKNKKAKQSFEKLAPYRQKEIARYINSLKTEESVDRNIKKAIGFLTGKERFVGRDKA
jgi:hypothetical protein